MRVTKNGKVVRRAMSQGHNRSRRSAAQARRKKVNRGLFDGTRIIKKYS